MARKIPNSRVIRDYCTIEFDKKQQRDLLLTKLYENSNGNPYMKTIPETNYVLKRLGDALIMK